MYKVYPDGNIDVETEQKLVESHGNLVLQFPIHWFNCPPLLKKWLDDVLAYGWAYGSNGGDKFKNRKVALGVTAGIKKKIIVKPGGTGIHLDKYWFRLKRHSCIAMQIIVRSLHFTAKKIVQAETKKKKMNRVQANWTKARKII